MFVGVTLPDRPIRDREALRPRLRTYGLVGDVYPFGAGLRVSAGVREGDNRMLLRAASANDEAVGTRDYAPVVTVGYAAKLSDHLILGADVGMLLPGKSARAGSPSMVSTPIDLQRGAVSPGGARRVVQLSAGYRF